MFTKLMNTLVEWNTVLLGASLVLLGAGTGLTVLMPVGVAVAALALCGVI